MRRSQAPGPEGNNLALFLSASRWDMLSRNPSRQSTMSSRSRTNLLSSPYDWGKTHRLYKRIYPSRINTLWYRRYVSKLPEDEQIDFQPFDEVQRVDEDIALQYFYGEDGHLEDSRIDRTDMCEKRRSALQRYNVLKEQEERDRAMQEEEANKLGLSWYSSIMKALKNRATSEFGATMAEKKVLAPLIEFMHKMSLKKRRQIRHVALKPGSRWKLLTNPAVSRKIMFMFKNLRAEENQARFRKVINLVVCAMRFIIVIRIISGSTKVILKELENFNKQQRAGSGRRASTYNRKKMFDPARYTFKDLQIPFETMLTLTKPWFVRTEKEIDKVLSVLQAYKSFVQYPPMFQRRLARLAWFTEIEANKYIIRERHIASDFYVLLKGKAKEVRLIGNPYFKAKSEMRQTRFIRKSEAFGDESMSDPECQRDYSIISCEPCSLLAISVYDYNVMLHTKKDNETAPEHILFISHLKIMDDFPKKKLLEEGDENITIHYFRQDSVISKNLKTCNYVFVVSNGNCRVVSEMPPERTATRSQGRRFNHIRSPGHGVSQRSSIAERDNIKQNVNRRINFHMTNKPLSRSRHDSLVHTLNKSLAGEIAELQEKSKQIIKTLPKTVRRTFTMGNFLKAVGRTQQAHFHRSESPRATLMAPRTVHSLASALSLDKWPAILEAEHIEAVSQKISEEKVATTEKTASSGSTTSSYTEYGEDDDSDISVISGSFVSSGSMSTLVKENSRAASTLIEEQQAEEAKSDDAKGADRLETDGKSKSQPSKAAARHSRGHFHRVRRELAVVDPRMFSRWKHIRSMNRGDYVGQEWLDFNKGPYEPPQETWSLVSDGCEVIMIKKTFLLKHLRRTW